MLFPARRRRLGLRRTEDSRRITILDRYSPTLMIYMLTVLLLSFVDAALTLILLQNGAVEINPVMRFYIDHGPQIFLLVKFGLTALASLIMIVLYANISLRYRSISALLFPFCIGIFGTIVLWEIYLLTRLNAA